MAEESSKSRSAKGEAPTPPDPPKADPAPDEKTYTVERLIAEAEAVAGVPPHVMAGALAEEKRKTITVAAAQEAVKTWLATPVAGT